MRTAVGAIGVVAVITNKHKSKETRGFPGFLDLDYCAAVQIGAGDNFRGVGTSPENEGFRYCPISFSRSAEGGQHQELQPSINGGL